MPLPRCGLYVEHLRELHPHIAMPIGTGNKRKADRESNIPGGRGPCRKRKKASLGLNIAHFALFTFPGVHPQEHDRNVVQGEPIAMSDD